MKIAFVSSKALSETTRLSLMKAQARLATAQKEVTTGRHADVGASLGFMAGQTVSLRNEHARLSTISDANSVAKTRISSTQAVLDGLADDAQTFIGALIGARSSDTGAQIVAIEARARLTSLVNGINTAVEGVHVFAGINTDFAPLSDYFADPPTLARQAVANAFLAAFGITQTDPAAVGITAADMQTFLDGAFDALTDEPAWSASWSTASDQAITSRISTGETIATSVSANAGAIRKLVSAYVMVADLGAERLNEGAFQAIVDTAVRTAGAAIQQLTGLRTALGIAEERIASADQRMSIQKDVLANHITNLESVDPYEASLRVTSLLTQIETAYALTARLHEMSLVYHL